MRQAIQVSASLLVLIPFALAQFGRIGPASLPYTLMNLAGSTVLAVQAAQSRQWGFLLLEGVWAIVSFIGVLRAIAARPHRQEQDQVSGVH